MRLNTHHQFLSSFLVLFFGDFLGGPTQLARQAGLGVDHECYGEVCLGESNLGQFDVPIFGWRRTMPNQSAEE
jgi:hypothetical protein